MRISSETVYTLLIGSRLGKMFWAEALSCIIYTLNCISKLSMSDKTPLELFYNKEPFNVRNLRRFGSKVIVQVPQEKREKFDLKGDEGIFIGFKEFTKGYKVYLTDEKMITVTGNVVFLNSFSGSAPVTAITHETNLELLITTLKIVVIT